MFRFHSHQRISQDYTIRHSRCQLPMPLAWEQMIDSGLALPYNRPARCAAEEGIPGG